MPVWHGKARYTNANSTIEPAGSSNASGAAITVTLPLNVTHPKFAAIAPSNTRPNTVDIRGRRDSLPDAQFAKIVTLHGAMPAQRERKNQNASNKQKMHEASTGTYP
jgi:hypothetical protein